ncbi:MAG: hypothetical protein WC107_06715 [Patescibacteria group bacterium]
MAKKIEMFTGITMMLRVLKLLDSQNMTIGYFGASSSLTTRQVGYADDNGFFKSKIDDKGDRIFAFDQLILAVLAARYLSKIDKDVIDEPVRLAAEQELAKMMEVTPENTFFHCESGIPLTWEFALGLMEHFKKNMYLSMNIMENVGCSRRQLCCWTALGHIKVVPNRCIHCSSPVPGEERRHFGLDGLVGAIICQEIHLQKTLQKFYDIPALTAEILTYWRNTLISLQPQKPKSQSGSIVQTKQTRLIQPFLSHANPTQTTISATELIASSGLLASEAELVFRQLERTNVLLSMNGRNGRVYRLLPGYEGRMKN